MSETQIEPRVFDKRSIIALAKAMELMGQTHGPFADVGLYFWKDEDETPDGNIRLSGSDEPTRGNRSTPNFIKWATWKAPLHLLPSGSAPRYLRMEVVPEGVAVTHCLSFYGTVIIGLPGMPKGKDSTRPKIQYITVSAEPEEAFVKAILSHLTKQ